MNKFLSALGNVSGKKADHLTYFYSRGDVVTVRLLREYGSVFVAQGGVVTPDVVIFQDDAEVEAFQSGLEISAKEIGGFPMELQTLAMDSLMAAIYAARDAGLAINPRGPDSARRRYDETVSLWLSRVEPALEHWIANGRLPGTAAERIRMLPTHEQVAEILKLEQDEIYFAKDLSKSILYSVAPPGTSQHLSMLAFDVAEFDDARVRKLLAGHGWFRTVVSDLPHFTFLGVGESELPGLGLKEVYSNGHTFWVPDMQ